VSGGHRQDAGLMDPGPHAHKALRSQFSLVQVYGLDHKAHLPLFGLFGSSVDLDKGFPCFNTLHKEFEMGPTGGLSRWQETLRLHKLGLCHLVGLRIHFRHLKWHFERSEMSSPWLLNSMIRKFYSFFEFSGPAKIFLDMLLMLLHEVDLSLILAIGSRDLFFILATGS
jgi:hypothetical protein